MNMFFHCLAILSFSAVTFASCPAGSIPSMSNSSTCFLIVPQKQRFLIAEEYCISKNGHLTSIHDIFANMHIQEHAQDNFTDSTTSDFWIGLNDLKSPGTWGWIDGSVLDFVDWDKGQPKNTPVYDCGGMNLQNGKWISDDCDKEKPYVCSIIATPKLQCPEGWSFFDETNSCYKVFANGSWDFGENTCYSHGGHLTSIHSLDENQFITNLIPWDPNNNGCNPKQYAYIGLFTVTNQATWRWSDNSPFNYSAWAPNHPCCIGRSFCGILWNGPPCNAPPETWANGICNENYGFFVCKKPAV